MKRAIGGCLLALGLAGCGGHVDRSPGATVRRPNKPPVKYVAEDDAQMNAAIARARSTVGGFIAALDAPKPTQSAFAVKKLITDGTTIEHMWLTKIQYRDGVFSGEISNEPDEVTGVKPGDKVSVKKSEISDWMYVDGGKLVGGYSIRLLRDRMAPKEREELDKQMPFKVD